MNRWQVLAIAVGAGAVALIYLHAPYVFSGQFMDGVEYFYYKNAPPPSPDVSYGGGLVEEELMVVALSVISACLALSKRASRRLRIAVLGFQFLQLCLFAISAPSFNQFLVAGLAWMFLFISSLFLCLCALGGYLSGVAKAQDGASCDV